MSLTLRSSANGVGVLAFVLVGATGVYCSLKVAQTSYRFLRPQRITLNLAENKWLTDVAAESTGIAPIQTKDLVQIQPDLSVTKVARFDQTWKLPRLGKRSFEPAGQLKFFFVQTATPSPSLKALSILKDEIRFTRSSPNLWNEVQESVSDRFQGPLRASRELAKSFATIDTLMTQAEPTTIEQPAEKIDGMSILNSQASQVAKINFDSEFRLLSTVARQLRVQVKKNAARPVLPVVPVVVKASPVPTQGITVKTGGSTREIDLGSPVFEKGTDDLGVVQIGKTNSPKENSEFNPTGGQFESLTFPNEQENQETQEREVKTSTGSVIRVQTPSGAAKQNVASVSSQSGIVAAATDYSRKSNNQPVSSQDSQSIPGQGDSKEDPQGNAPIVETPASDELAALDIRHCEIVGCGSHGMAMASKSALRKPSEHGAQILTQSKTGGWIQINDQSGYRVITRVGPDFFSDPKASLKVPSVGGHSSWLDQVSRQTDVLLAPKSGIIFGKIAPGQSVKSALGRNAIYFQVYQGKVRILDGNSDQVKGTVYYVFVNMKPGSNLVTTELNGLKSSVGLPVASHSATYLDLHLMTPIPLFVGRIPASDQSVSPDSSQTWVSLPGIPEASAVTDAAGFFRLRNIAGIPNHPIIIDAEEKGAYRHRFTHHGVVTSSEQPAEFYLISSKHLGSWTLQLEGGLDPGTGMVVAAFGRLGTDGQFFSTKKKFQAVALDLDINSVPRARLAESYALDTEGRLIPSGVLIGPSYRAVGVHLEEGPTRVKITDGSGEVWSDLIFSSPDVINVVYP